MQYNIHRKGDSTALSLVGRRIMIGIYKWTNKINNKSYIGQSINIEQRRRQHISTSYYPKSNTYNTIFHQAIRKYGVDNFTFEIICICNIEELDVLESFYIKKFNTLAPNGYNMTEGGENARSCNSFFSEDDVKNIINELRNTDDKAEIIADRWNCSASLIKKICYGEEYFINGEQYPIRNQEHIKRIMNKYNPFCNGKNPSAKLSISDVEDIICDLLETDLSIIEIAQKYNISKDQISRINNGKIWQQVERPIPCRDTKRDNERRALVVADLLLNTKLSQSEIMEITKYKDRHTIQRINNHKIYIDLLKEYPNPIRS